MSSAFYARVDLYLLLYKFGAFTCFRSLYVPRFDFSILTSKSRQSKNVGSLHSSACDDVVDTACGTVADSLIQGGSNMTGTNCDLFTHNQSRSYLNHLLSCRQNSFQARSQCCEKPLLALSCLSVCPSAWNSSAPVRLTLMKFHVWAFFENLSRNVAVCSEMLKST